MKTIGLIGGTTWHSTVDYYRIINETMNTRFNNNTSAKILLYSANYGEIFLLTQKLDWDGIAEIICSAAKKLETAGADCLLLCANTMHIVADRVKAVVNIPLIHIADVVIEEIQREKLSRVLLLGTKYTMAATFYSAPLKQLGIDTIVPSKDEIEIINSSIYNELGKGIFLPATKIIYVDMIERFRLQGAEGVILGCTEIPMLIKQRDCVLPLLDTTQLHAVAAVDFALG